MRHNKVWINIAYIHESRRRRNVLQRHAFVKTTVINLCICTLWLFDADKSRWRRTEGGGRYHFLVVDRFLHIRYFDRRRSLCAPIQQKFCSFIHRSSASGCLCHHHNAWCIVHGHLHCHNNCTPRQVRLHFVCSLCDTGWQWVKVVPP